MPQVLHHVSVHGDADAVVEALHDVLPDLRHVSGGARAGGETVFEANDAEIPAPEAVVRVRIEPTGETTDVSIETTARLRVPFFGWFFVPLLRLAQRRRRRYIGEALVANVEGGPAPGPPKPIPLLPTERFNQEQTTMLAAAALAAAIATFGAGLFGQQADFVADSFDSSDAALGRSLAVSRLGVIVSVIVTAAADRRGRRVLLVVAVVGVGVANLASAFAPNLETFTAFQVLVRGFVNSALAVAGIAALEEAPERSRGFSTAMIALAAGLGFSFAVATLPISDLGSEAWRISFALSGVSLVLIPRLARLLPESRRYLDIVTAHIERGQLKELLSPRLRRLLLLLGAMFLLGNLFNAPSSQLMNRFLSDERGFSGFDIAVFRAVTTSLSGLLGLLIASRLIEMRGRKPVGGVGVVAGHSIQIVFFLASGALLWLSSAGSVFFAAGGGIALAALSAEVFPTEVRATSSALLTIVAVIGSATGLVLAGELSDPLGGLGNAIALLGIPAVLAVALIVPRLPEPAGRRLDDVSPIAAPPSDL